MAKHVRVETPTYSKLVCGCSDCEDDGCGGGTPSPWGNVPNPKGDRCTDCKCDEKIEASCTMCKNWNLLGGFCKQGEEKCSSECFDPA